MIWDYIRDRENELNQTLKICNYHRKLQVKP